MNFPSNTLFLSFGFALAFLFSACSDPATSEEVIPETGCAPANCDGCCDVSGVCRLGQDATMCGHGGTTCVDCSSQEADCREGLCVQPGCGDGVRSETEECDGEELGDASCVTQGYVGGTLACDPTCRFDTSNCEPLTCEMAAQDANLPCTWCSPDGTTIVRCGFCRTQPGGPIIVDSDEVCEAGTSCHSWVNPMEGNTLFECRDAAPELCPEDFVEECDGNIVTRCSHNGVVIRQDCASDGNICEIVGHPVCVDPDAQPCDPSTFRSECVGDLVLNCNSFTSRTEIISCGEPGDPLVCRPSGIGTVGCVLPGALPCDPTTFEDRCSGDNRVVCTAATGFEAIQQCGADQTCFVTATGPSCQPKGTTTCDPATYLPSCQGDLSLSCNQVTGWETVFDCGAVGDPGVMTCHQDTAGTRRCVPQDLVTCDGTEPPRCENNSTHNCHDAFWLESDTCAGANPLCVVETHPFTTATRAICANSGPTACAGDWSEYRQTHVDKYGGKHDYMGLRCASDSTIVGCSVSQVEVSYQCPSGTICAPVSNPYYDAWCARL